MSGRTLTATLLVLLLLTGACGKRGPTAQERLAARMDYNSAVGFLQKGELQLALTHFRKALANLSKDAMVHNGLGLVYYRMGNIEQALASYELSIKYDRDLPDVRNNYAIALIAAERYAEAIEQCERALADGLYGTPAAALFNMAKAYQSMGDEEKAVEHFQRAIQNEPGFDRPSYELARIKSKRGSYEEAEELLVQSLQRNRFAFEAYYELAMVRYTRGARPGAEKSLRNLLEVAPETHPIREDAVRFMETVLGTGR